MSYRSDLDSVTPCTAAPDAADHVPPELDVRNKAPRLMPPMPRRFSRATGWCGAGRTPHGDLVHAQELARARIQAAIAVLDAALTSFPTDDEVTAMAIEFTPRTASEIELKKQAPKGIHRAQVAEASEGMSL